MNSPFEITSPHSPVKYLFKNFGFHGDCQLHSVHTHPEYTLVHLRSLTRSHSLRLPQNHPSYLHLLPLIKQNKVIYLKPFSFYTYDPFSMCGLHSYIHIDDRTAFYPILCFYTFFNKLFFVNFQIMEAGRLRTLLYLLRHTI